MSIPLALLAASPALRPPRAVPRAEPVRCRSTVADRLIVGGASLEIVALATFVSLRFFGLLNLDTMTLLPAAACAGAAATCLGVVLACLRALADA